MEWVTTSGRSVEEAQDRALDQLGIDASEAEFEVLSDVKLGLFGRVKEEARVRARVRPTQQRDADRRRQRDRRGKPRSSRDNASGVGPSSSEASASVADDESSGDQTATEKARRPTGPAPRQGSKARQQRPTPREGNVMSDEMRSAEESKGREFLTGLLDAAGVEGSVEVRRDDDVSELTVSGESLGFLIGPRGATLAAVQALTRAVAQRDHERGDHRLTVDISGYSQRRRAALEAFAHQVAGDVASSGRPKILDPMIASERKIVHDVLNGVDGVSTSSVGEEPRRSVVISPA